LTFAGSNTATVGGDAFAGRFSVTSTPVVAAGALSLVTSWMSDSAPVLNCPLAVGGYACRRCWRAFTTKPCESTWNAPARV
jgi:hypothetical protein